MEKLKSLGSDSAAPVQPSNSQIASADPPTPIPGINVSVQVDLTEAVLIRAVEVGGPSFLLVAVVCATAMPVVWRCFSQMANRKQT
ncbi:hypothetical protein [Leptolyngbya ohadii]|uniref:hypothetical protein n=1 Tax=Leptolyngbya ohadii TaxID=1962290 RepID=UPI00117BB05C|nr:hypothetical protein [Leptolyngbya ohadii]